MSAPGIAPMVAYRILLMALAVPLGRGDGRAHGSQALRASRVDIAPSSGQSGGHIADKEMRFGSAGSGFSGSVTTSSSGSGIAAGSLARKGVSPGSLDTLRTDSPTFGVALVAVGLITSGLTILPSQVLGPVAEGLSG